MGLRDWLGRPSRGGAAAILFLVAVVVLSIRLLVSDDACPLENARTRVDPSGSNGKSASLDEASSRAADKPEPLTRRTAVVQERVDEPEETAPRMERGGVEPFVCTGDSGAGVTDRLREIHRRGGDWVELLDNERFMKAINPWNFDLSPTVAERIIRANETLIAELRRSTEALDAGYQEALERKAAHGGWEELIVPTRGDPAFNPRADSQVMFPALQTGEMGGAVQMGGRLVFVRLRWGEGGDFHTQRVEHRRLIEYVVASLRSSVYASAQ